MYHQQFAKINRASEHLFSFSAELALHFFAADQLLVFVTFIAFSQGKIVGEIDRKKHRNEIDTENKRFIIIQIKVRFRFE